VLSRRRPFRVLAPCLPIFLEFGCEPELITFAESRFDGLKCPSSNFAYCAVPCCELRPSFSPSRPLLLAARSHFTATCHRVLLGADSLRRRGSRAGKGKGEGDGREAPLLLQKRVSRTIHQRRERQNEAQGRAGRRGRGEFERGWGRRCRRCRTARSLFDVPDPYQRGVSEV